MCQTAGVWNADDHSIDMRQKADEATPPGTYDKLMKLMDESRLANDKQSIQDSVAERLLYDEARLSGGIGEYDLYLAAAIAVRDRLTESFNATNQWYQQEDVKRGYYLSAEYLMGRFMHNAVANLDIETNFKDALMDIGIKIEDLYESEADPALGNGGLGRLAACFLDSMASLSLPCWGYGIRYTFGMFKQHIVNGRQVERPDFWLGKPCPWEIPRPNVCFPVRFGGRVEERDGRRMWTGGVLVQAMAYDYPIPGFGTGNTNNLRLWRALPDNEFDFDAFDEGRYVDAIASRRSAEELSSVLYPKDATLEGEELRLRQQFFFCSASMQDILVQFKKKPDRQWSELPGKVAIQMNDTHPTISVAELMRLLVDNQGVGWDEAWDLTTRTLNYTNHTVMPEALEKWPVDMMQSMLPRHVEIIQEINRRWLEQVREKWGDGPAVQVLSIFGMGPMGGHKEKKMGAESGAKEEKIRMGNLAIVGANKVNGVAALHTEIIKKETFPEYYNFWRECGQPDKIVNMTNGVTPRRWINVANPTLSAIFTKYLGSRDWLTDLEKTKGMLKHLGEPKLQEEWTLMKRSAKENLALWLKDTIDLDVDCDALFDIQIKRIHEYKRQLLFCLYVIHRYQWLKGMSADERKKVQKRVCLIGGKAASAYIRAKTIIKLVGNVGKVINNDPDTCAYLKLAFMTNYSVSAAQKIIPASDISEHISTAGTEASGTSNMKFVMNGGLIVGTMDGANVEIREDCGHDTMFIFGCLEHEVGSIKERAKQGNYPIDPRLQNVFNAIKSGQFSCNEADFHSEICAMIDTLQNTRAAGTWDGDRYLVINDFPSYVDTQARVDKIYSENKAEWCKLSIKAASSMAKFSTDRTMREYSEVIWGVKPAPRPQARTEAPAPSEISVGQASLGSKPAPEPSAKNAEEVSTESKPAPAPSAKNANEVSTESKPAPAPSAKNAKEVSTESKPAPAPSEKSAEQASLGSKPAPAPSGKNAKEASPKSKPATVQSGKNAKEASLESKPAPAPSGKNATKAKPESKPAEEVEVEEPGSPLPFLNM